MIQEFLLKIVSKIPLKDERSGFNLSDPIKMFDMQFLLCKLDIE